MNSNESVDVYREGLHKQSILYSRVSNQRLACILVAELPEHVRQLIHTSSQIDALDVNQLLEQIQAILKVKASVAEPVIAATKPE